MRKIFLQFVKFFEGLTRCLNPELLFFSCWLAPSGGEGGGVRRFVMATAADVAAAVVDALVAEVEKLTSVAKVLVAAAVTLVMVA